MMKISPEKILRLISYWPPYAAAGISVTHVDLSKGEVRARLKIYPFNRNYFGTHFGGSLFAMCDPFYVFILAHFMGKGYYIWDKKSTIDFVKATSEPVFATFVITPDQAKEIAAQAESGQKVEPEFSCEIVTKSGEVIARIQKTLYIKKKKTN